MRNSKRTLAGIAAGALTLGLIPFAVAVAPAANAASLTGATSPVRVTYTGSVLDAVPYAAVTWTSGSTATVSGSDTAVVTLTTAPSSAARVQVAAAQGTPAFTSAGAAGVASLTTPSNAVAVATFDNTTKEQSILIAANEPGSYAGTLTVTHASGAVASDTVSFSFTTRGKATQMALTVDTPVAPVSTAGVKIATVSLKDATGAATQPVYGDSVALASTEGALTFSPASPLVATDLALGSKQVTTTTLATAGTYTLSATPAGTLPAGGATTQSGNYTTFATASPTGISLLNTSDVLITNDAVVGTPGVAAAKPALTTLNFGVAVASADAGKVVMVQPSGTAFLGVTQSPIAVATGTNAKGTFSVTVPAAGAINGNGVTVAAAGPVSYGVSYVASAVIAGDITRTPSAGTIAVATGSTQSIVVNVADQYGNGVSGFVVRATADDPAATAVQGISGNDGNVALALPDKSTAADTTVVWTFVTTNPNTGATLSAPSTLTLTYSASGAVTVSAMTFDGTAAASYTTSPAVPFGGLVGSAPATAAGQKAVAVTVAVSVPNTQVTFTGDEGVAFLAANPGGGGTSVTSTSVKSTLTVAASGSTATVYVFSTKTGKRTVNAVSSSGSKVSGTITYQTAPAAARDITLVADPTKQQVDKPSNVTVTVKDVFGNPVQLDGSGTPSVTVQTDKGTLAGGVSIYKVTATNTEGRATISLLSATPGVSTLTAAASGGQFGDLVNVPFTGAAVSVDKAAATVEYTLQPTDKKIAITGSRTTVSGKPGIKIEGVTNGFDNGATVKPYFRFPGETAYTEGTARPVITDGEFTWQRKTGKKFYAYVTSDDGQVQSNRVIIAAN